jgi:ribosome biogenesis GTPase A
MERAFKCLAIKDCAVLIGIVGVTGSGKSSLIKTVTGRKDVKIGPGLCSSMHKN